jgi:hypothetical protein
MNNWIRIPGFPPPEKQSSVRFYVFKSLSYNARMLLYLILIAIGFLFQILTLKVWPGAIFLVCATILNLVRGYDSRVRFKGFHTDSDWTQVDMDSIRKIEELDNKMTKWDRDILDISNASGSFMFVLMVFGLLFVYLFFGRNPAYSTAVTIFICDIVILVLPIWFNGIRRILKQGNLSVKVNIISNVEKSFQKIKKDGENFKPALLLSRDNNGNSIPRDVKFNITFDNAPADFYGVQGQVSINLVQGSSYPYFYCVIVAKTGFGLGEFRNKILPFKDIDMDFADDGTAEIILIKQCTRKPAGYHTKINDCNAIMETALKAARILIGDKQQ